MAKFGLELVHFKEGPPRTLFSLEYEDLEVLKALEPVEYYDVEWVNQLIKDIERSELDGTCEESTRKSG